MKTNRWIESSQKFFARLLNLYPRDYRDEFSVSMQQVFSDLCRDAYREKGAPGILFLWLRVLPDLGYTAVLEHLTSPRAAWGLMEPVPNAPLPWKGVFMILLPGMVFLISQIAQLSGEPWYLAVYYRAAFVLIIPVLVVWAVTRRFPVWGLIPVGMLFRLVKEIGFQLITIHPGAFSQNAFLNFILQIAQTIQNDLWILSLIFVLCIVLLAVWYFRKNRPTRGFWIFLAGFLLILIQRIAYEVSPVIASLNQIPTTEKQLLIQDFLRYNISYILYNAIAPLFLVFIGTLFTREQGFFTIFILVGYVLPVMVVGIPWFQEFTDENIIILSIGVLLYRSLLSLVAPIWMSRSRSQSGKRRAIVCSIFAAMTVHAIMQFYPVYFNLSERIDYPNWIQFVASDELILIFTFLVGLALYQVNLPSSGASAQAYGAFTELTTEKA
ncbi:MAG TPA: hypothetical protein VF338_06530 [Leptolinea sp.]